MRKQWYRKKTIEEMRSNFGFLRRSVVFINWPGIKEKK